LIENRKNTLKNAKRNQQLRNTSHKNGHQTPGKIKQSPNQPHKTTTGLPDQRIRKESSKTQRTKEATGD
jgi:hypothetical protein